MFKYTIKRVLQSLGTVLIVVSIVSLLLSLMPTDYFFTEEQLIKLTDKQKEDQLAAAGLLDSPIVQLFRFLENLILKFDLGTSRRIQAGVPVIKVIGDKFAISMRLGCIALAISLILGVPMGILQARHKDHLFDHIGAAYTIFVNAVPRLVSYSLVLVIGVKLFGLPSMYSTRHAVRSSVLPIICLAMGSTASYALWMRRYMVDELTKDYIKLARIKGLSTRQIMFKHVLRNAFVPMVQNLPTSFMLTIGGSLLVERFFSIPGMGPLLTDSITRYDLNMVRGLVLLYALLGIFGLFLGDVLMTVCDPRIRLTGKGGDTR
jgi:oligopeptide transport system permease protein